METASKTNLTNSLNKALALFDHFADRAVIGLSELSRLAGMPKATVYRLASTLERNGFLRKVDVVGRENQYALGMKLLELGHLVADRLELREVALPYMRELRDSVNECVQLVVKDHDEAIYIEKLEGDRPVRVYTRVGRRAPLYGGACPRAILSFMSDEAIDAYLRRVVFTSYTPNTIVDEGTLRESIADARARGHTISYAELQSESAAVGAPLFDARGMVVGSISIAGPESRFGESSLPFLIRALLETTSRISENLGYKKK